MLTQYGITKQITGHFHESVHRAHDLSCAPIKQGEFTNELFWNASYVDRGLIGILHVDEEKVAYENIDLKQYLK